MTTKTRKTMTQDERDERRAEQEARVKELHEKITQGVRDIRTSDDWLRMLEFASRFHRYSFNNMMLIFVQRPDATLVNGYGRKDGSTGWLSMGRHVRKGEKSIKIFAPVLRWFDKEDDNGQPVRVNGEIVRVQRLVGFRVVSVFDVSQTEGDDLPSTAHLLTGASPAGLWESVEQHINDLGFRVERAPAKDLRGANGRTSRDPENKVVRVRDDVDEAQATKTLVHELGHIVLGHLEESFNYETSRDLAEVAAESVAAIVCMAAGLDTGAYSFGYVANWSGGNDELVQSTAQAVVSAATDLVGRHVA